MAIDHSLTYKIFKLKNIPHIIRLRTLQKLIGEFGSTQILQYADFGCSTGYLTNKFSNLVDAENAVGFDHSDNIEKARKTYPQINFEYINLNEKIEFSQKYCFITCLETLEHVGDIEKAVKNLKDAAHNESKIIISVPIEIGIVGIFKYIVKRFLYRYDLPLKCSDTSYLMSLIKFGDISKFREAANGYGSHFGFDYRIVDREIDNNFSLKSVKIFNSATTRYYAIDMAIENKT